MDEAQKTEIAMRYAVEWYTYHAGQRMTAVRFYLAIIGALLIGYVQTYSGHPGWALGIALFGVVVSLVFWVLDVRNTELVMCGRAALDKLEQDLGVHVRADDREREHLRSASRVASWALEHVRSPRVQLVWRFQFWLRLLHLVTFAGSFLLAVNAWRSPAELSPGPITVEAHSQWSQVRALRTMIEEYLLTGKQETSEAVLAAQGTMVESEILAGLRSCRLGLGADPLCDRYEVWTDRALASLRPLRTASGDRAKAALQSFADTYARDLRAELGELESQFSRRALGSLSRPGPVASEGQLGAKGESR